jgi:hypothetical protein
LCHIQRLAMDLPMAVGMQEHSVFRHIAAPMRSPDDVMVLSSRHAGDFLVADRASTVLLLPLVQQFPSLLEVVRHLYA